jgi:alkylation response protein AidB-like acyl-CoA dehydrogenase
MNDSYTAPLDEMVFVLDKVIGWQQAFELPPFHHVDAELAQAVLSEGARFCEQVLGPLNAVGDEQGSQLIDGSVVTPNGFIQAFRGLSDGGWVGLDLPEEFGGQALPQIVQTALSEMINGACVSFGMLPIMLRAAAWLILEHGDQALIDRVVPDLVAGKCAATICITEPQAGSDVGRLRTRAEPIGNGTYALSGNKIFISYGDHDLTEQIVHLVLARTPDAPAGTRGISLFAVPKKSFDDGRCNRVSVGRLEKKMGLHASPTCSIDFDGAVGYRIGDECAGLKCMFTMVNLMRLEVSVQGVAIGSAATNKARKYAAERPQGGDPSKAPVAIIEHADVRRMLLMMMARVSSMRALTFEAALCLDKARAAATEQERRDARYLAEFLLPICKACSSETGFEVANTAIQVLGGHGYVSEAGVEQYARDARVMAIYEGTNGIQALDLVSRKLLKDDGVRYTLFVARIRASLSELSSREDLTELCSSLQRAFEEFEQCTEQVIAVSGKNSRALQTIATDYLQLAGLVAGGWMCLRIAAAAVENSSADEHRRGLANFYMRYQLPLAQTHAARIRVATDLERAICNEVLLAP